jgi:hypothetical protein
MGADLAASDPHPVPGRLFHPAQLAVPVPARAGALRPHGHGERGRRRSTRRGLTGTGRCARRSSDCSITW